MSRCSFPALLFLACLGLCAALFLSLRFGSADLGVGALWSDTRGILESRLFRTACAMAVGAALAISGLMLQALTRNPLADPGITGVNAGAALAAVALAYLAPGATGGGAVLVAASLGAAASGLALWRLAGGVSATGMEGIALRLPLAGLAIEALCLSLASALILTDAEMQARYLRWLSGAIPAVARGEAPALGAITLLLLSGFFLCGRLELLSLGAQTSDSLGRSPVRTVALTLAHVTGLSGASVAIAGPLAFLGLLVPFVARGVARGDLRHSYLLAVPLGATALLLADTAGRVVAPPGEVEAGILAALCGGPALIVVLRRLLNRGQAA
ncbi:FecCD family ABC transporter permease [Celeribacter indicus]|uniref:Ferric siderophore ABC transporter membrane protein n=1 Tax=Celeribacter indicus TaxID=1208324 RepID=A0A0B5E8S2_9RHOB|nr:iron ABC transporter permease [Celeribacter indicus]AJE48702.1 ferric siderophore ABC transporter membrane protein [Celeribacter indicus]SDX12571.1 iron complex transport system permease protein [Celeribacter indicus]